MFHGLFFHNWLAKLRFNHVTEEADTFILKSGPAVMTRIGPDLADTSHRETGSVCADSIVKTSKGSVRTRRKSRRCGRGSDSFKLAAVPALNSDLNHPI